MLTIEQPHFLWLAPLIIALIIGMMWYVYRIKWSVAKLAAPEHRALMLPRFRLWRIGLWFILMAIALASIWFTLLRVRYDTGEREQRQECARDVIIALDISKSMLAQDVDPSRLAGAKRKVMQLIKMLHMERIGLILFSQHACVQCPLTKDIGAFTLLLQAVDDDVLSSGGTTALDQALYTAVKMCERSGENHQKLLLVITDGEDFSEQLSQARDAAQRAGLRIGMLGIGTAAGAPVPLRSVHGALQGHQRDEQGNIVISRLQPQLLQDMAHQFGGTYCTVDMQKDADIQHVVSWIQKHDATVFTTQDQAVKGETCMYGALAAWCALVCAWLV